MAISTSDGRYYEDEFDLVASTEPTARITIRPPGEDITTTPNVPLDQTGPFTGGYDDTMTLGERQRRLMAREPDVLTLKNMEKEFETPWFTDDQIEDSILRFKQGRDPMSHLPLERKIQFRSRGEEPLPKSLPTPGERDVKKSVEGDKTDEEKYRDYVNRTYERGGQVVIGHPAFKLPLEDQFRIEAEVDESSGRAERRRKRFEQEDKENELFKLSPKELRERGIKPGSSLEGFTKLAAEGTEPRDVTREDFDWANYTSRGGHRSPSDIRDSGTLRRTDLSYDAAMFNTMEPLMSNQDLSIGMSPRDISDQEKYAERVRTNLSTQNPMDAFEAAAERTRARYPKREAKPMSMSEYLKSTAPPEGERYQTWPEKMVRSIIDKVAHAMAVIRGEKEALSDETIAATTEIAGAVIFGPAPIARKAIDGTLGTIAGVKATNANIDKLKTAIEMNIVKQESVEKIWKETGWYKGSDGRWRHEIPGSEEAHLIPTAIAQKTEGKLPEFFKYPELYKAYPEMKDVNFKIISKEEGGAYLAYVENPSFDTIYVNLTAIREQKKDPISIILHEIQHVVQGREGFDNGGNPLMFLRQAREALIHKMINRPWIEREEYLDVLDTMTIPSAASDLANRLYKRSPGEIEANLVGDVRSMMNPEVKAVISPKETQRRLEELGQPSEFRIPKKGE